MLVEKKSFRRFLVVYITSTLFLLFVGTLFYYKMSHQAILDSEISQMKKNIENFIETNYKSRFIFTGTIPKYGTFPIAIYMKTKFITGNFTPKNIDFSKEKIISGKRLYYIKKEQKRWGKVYFVTYSNVEPKLTQLFKEIGIFIFLSIVFIVGVSFVLGKIFLKPMKETIESLENFIADATHEINTPISNILINIELSKELYPECRSTEEFQKIESSAFRISNIFKDLSFIKLNHKQNRTIQKCAVDEVLKERIGFFETFIQNKELEFSTEIERVVLEIDKEELVRLIDNLLSNAIKYTAEKGKINVYLSTEALSVFNDGKIKDTQNILQKFARENKNEGGFGLGLSIVSKICEHYGFTFSIVSENQKVISTVLF